MSVFHALFFWIRVARIFRTLNPASPMPQGVIATTVIRKAKGTFWQPLRSKGRAACSIYLVVRASTVPGHVDYCCAVRTHVRRCSVGIVYFFPLWNEQVIQNKLLRANVDNPTPRTLLQ